MVCALGVTTTGESIRAGTSNPVLECVASAATKRSMESGHLMPGSVRIPPRVHRLRPFVEVEPRGVPSQLDIMILPVRL
jgi:hypothetical protein